MAMSTLSKGSLNGFFKGYDDEFKKHSAYPYSPGACLEEEGLRTSIYAEYSLLQPNQDLCDEHLQLFSANFVIIAKNRVNYALERLGQKRSSYRATLLHEVTRKQMVYELNELSWFVITLNYLQISLSSKPRCTGISCGRRREGRAYCLCAVVAHSFF